jgi:FkbM family methyltransferase
MYVDAREIRAGLFLGDYEPATTAVFESLIAPGDTVVDIGAHWGYFTLLAARQCGEGGKVVAFEPDPRNYSILLRNVQANRLNNVSALQAAVTDRTGEGTLHLASNSSMHSLYELGSDLRAGEVGVSCVTLDDLAEKVPIQPSLIKMDIEGGEPRAYAGMRSLLARFRRINMIVEFLPHYLGTEAARAFLNTLFQSGFHVAIIDDRRYRVAAGSVDQLLAKASEDEADGYVSNLLCRRGDDSDSGADPLVGMRRRHTLTHPLPKRAQL